MKRGLLVAVLILLAAPLCAQAQAPGSTLPDPYAGKKKILVIADDQTGFAHDSVSHAMAVIEKLGRDSGAYIAFLRTDSQLVTKSPVPLSGVRYSKAGINNARNLNYFDAVFFLSSGEGTLSDKQKADLLSFVHDDGKAIILGHSETIAFYNWPEWGVMIGGFMLDPEYPATGMNAVTLDPQWPGAGAFDKNFLWVDQFPHLRPEFKRGDVHTIVALDPSKMSSAERAWRTDDYFPIVWAKNYGKGRVFNFTPGHNDATYDDPKSQALLLGGIKWALGLTQADATPDKN